jgi:hypothetical protein
MLKPDRSYRWGMTFAQLGFGIAAMVLVLRSCIARSPLSTAVLDLARHPASPMGMAFLVGGLMIVVGACYYLFAPVFCVLDDSEPPDLAARPPRPPRLPASVPPGHTLH